MDAGDQPRQETTILLLGQKESGKSDVGNAILGMKTFNRSGRGKSVILPAWAEIDTETEKYEMMLVDGPDLEDIDLKKLQGKEGTCDKLGLAMGLCESGVNAFVLVLKYGVPLTKDHRIVIEAAEKMLGEKWLSNNGIVVMCGGKDWHDDMKRKNKNISFEQWCKDQNGAYGNIFSKCGYRCVLFENSEPNEEHKQKLFEYLMSWAKQIRKNYGRYTNEHFKAAATNLAKFIDKLNAPILHIKIQKGTSLLTSKCMKLDNMLAYSEKMKVIGAILDRANGLLNDIAEESNKTEKLDELKTKVTELRKKAHQAEKNLLDSPESVLSDFVGIKRSAKAVEDLRTDPDLWLQLAEAALIGLKVGGVSLFAAGLLALFEAPIAAPAAAVSGAVVGASALLYGVAKYKINTRPVPVVKGLKAVDKPRQRINILLLGKETNGKATVGNAILGMKAFKKSTTGNSLLPAWAVFDTETEEYELMVVDGPDVNAINLKNLQLIGREPCEHLELAMGFCEYGVDLFVLVMRYNDRFTENERSILHALRNMLGPDWLSQHGVVVMTHGDTSKDELKRASKYFTGWCIRNDESYGGFFSECRQRCFLFDIERPDALLKQATFQELITVAKQMKDTYGPCNNKHFEEAVANRDTLIAHLNAPIFNINIQKEISLLTSKFTMLSDKLLYREKMKLIGAIIDRADGLLNDIARIDKGTGKLSKQKKNVTMLREQVVQADRGLRASPETRLGDYMDMQACTEMLEDMRRDPSLWEDFKGLALKGLKESNESLKLGAAGLILHEAGFRD